MSSFFEWAFSEPVIDQINETYKKERYLALQDELNHAKAVEARTRARANNLAEACQQAEIEYSRAADEVRRLERQLR